MHITIFTKMRKECENLLIFVKFHQILFRQIFRFRENFRNKLTKTKNFAKVVEKTKNLMEFDGDPACMAYVVSLFFI
jgi:hypothetical protein